MPAFCTHYIFSEEMADKIRSELGFEINKSVADIGAQGPDIFFFCRIIPLLMPGRAGRRIGSMLHRSEPSEIFDAFAEYLKKSEDRDIAKSYIYGFIMHYALDRKCHPYVYAYVEKIREHNRFIHRNSAHNIIEMGMDAYLLHKRLGIDKPSDFDSAATISLSDRELDEISSALCFMIKRVTGQGISASYPKTAIEDTAKMQALLRDRHGILRAICVITESVLAPIIRYFKFSSMIKPKGWKNSLRYANIDNSEWRSPYDSDKARRESFEELYEEAAEEALRLIKGFEAICRGEADSVKITENISFLTGCEVKQI